MTVVPIVILNEVKNLQNLRVSQEITRSSRVMTLGESFAKQDCHVALLLAMTQLGQQIPSSSGLTRGSKMSKLNPVIASHAVAKQSTLNTVKPYRDCHA